MLKFNIFSLICFYSYTITISNCAIPVILNEADKHFKGQVNGNLIIITQKQSKSLDKAWSTSYVTIRSNKSCIVHDGVSLVDIEKSGTSSIMRILSKFKASKEALCDQSVFVSPFKDYYIQIEVNGPLEIEYNFTHVDFRLIVICVLALMLFFEAEIISKSVSFYYASGVSIGLIGSVLILLIVLSRFIPKRTTAAITFLTGSSVFLFAMRWIFYNFKETVESFQVYIIAYFGLSVLVSVLYLYYRGPVTNPRTFKIIEFLLKFISGVMLYCGLSFKELFISLIIAYCLANLIIKFKSISIIKKLKFKYFPPTRKLLTEEQYVKEGYDFTQQSLKELSEYCHSPDCDSWRVISRLKSPDRFARFIMHEEPHINDAELDEYEKFSINNDLIDDDL